MAICLANPHAGLSGHPDECQNVYEGKILSSGEAPSVVNCSFGALIFHDFGLDHFIYIVHSGAPPPWQLIRSARGVLE